MLACTDCLSCIQVQSYPRSSFNMIPDCAGCRRQMHAFTLDEHRPQLVSCSVLLLRLFPASMVLSAAACDRSLLQQNRQWSAEEVTPGFHTQVLPDRTMNLRCTGSFIRAWHCGIGLPLPECIGSH